jgi:outer membrane protein assembly factor BamB
VGAKGLWTMKPTDLYMEDLWDFFLSSPVIGVNGPGINKGPTVYFGSSDGNLYALDAISGSLKWKFKTNGIINTSPALYDGIVYFGSWDTYMYAADAQTGKEI